MPKKIIDITLVNSDAEVMRTIIPEEYLLRKDNRLEVDMPRLQNALKSVGLELLSLAEPDKEGTMSVYTISTEIKKRA